MITDLALSMMDGPFVPGEADCCTAACDVFRVLHGVDPMEPLRGAYCTAYGARMQIARRGGWLAMCEALAGQAGLTRSAGGEGHLGLAQIGDDYALVIGIERGLWAGKGNPGVVTVREVVASWQRC